MNRPRTVIDQYVTDRLAEESKMLLSTEEKKALRDTMLALAITVGYAALTAYINKSATKAKVRIRR